MGFFSNALSKKSSKAKFICGFCGKTFEDDTIHSRIGETDSRACGACIPKMIAITFCKTVHDENREMTVEELQRYEVTYNAKGIEGMKKALTEVSKNRDRTTPYDAVAIDSGGHPVLTFTCPKCSQKGVLNLDKPTFALDQFPVKTFAQAEFFRMLKPILSVTCGHCKENVTLSKS